MHLRFCGGKRQETNSQCTILGNIRAQDPLTSGDSSPRQLLDLPLCSSFPPIVWRQGKSAISKQSNESSLSRTDAKFSHAHFPLPASTMTGRRRPLRGQNGSNERLFWSLAVIIVVLVISYCYDGGDDDATKQNKGEYAPVLPRLSGSQSKSWPWVREL